MYFMRIVEYMLAKAVRKTTTMKRKYSYAFNAKLCLDIIYNTFAQSTQSTKDYFSKHFLSQWLISD